MKKRQLTGVLLCAALAAGMLAGCGQKAGATETAGGQTAAESQKETQGEKKAKGCLLYTSTSVFCGWAERATFTV